MDLSRGLGDVYKRQVKWLAVIMLNLAFLLHYPH
jgi:hypothetical protein